MRNAAAQSWQSFHTVYPGIVCKCYANSHCIFSSITLSKQMRFFMSACVSNNIVNGITFTLKRFCLFLSYSIRVFCICMCKCLCCPKRPVIDCFCIFTLRIVFFERVKLRIIKGMLSVFVRCALWLKFTP